MLQTRLKVVDHTADDLGDTLGITQDRAGELAKALDDFCKPNKGLFRIVYIIDIIQYMETICNTQEEFIWLINNHIAWLYKTGRAVFKNKKEANNE